MYREASYLAFIPDIFGEGNYVFSILKNNQVSNIDPSDLEHLTEPVVCFATNDLIDQTRALNVKPPSIIYDLEQARKLSVGLPSKESPKKLWDGWSVLKRNTKNKKDIEKYKSLFTAKDSINNVADTTTLINSYLMALKSSWIETVEILKDEREFERYFNLEAPVQDIFNYRQSLGLKIDLADLNHKYEILRTEKYKAYVRVANALNISPSGFTFRSIREHLSGTELEILLDGTNVSRFEQKLKLAATNSPLAADIISLLRSDRDLRLLSRLSDVNGRSHPTFAAVGTVSGRILVRNPYIQGIRKKYRSVLIAEEGYRLLYLDYDQFEPGILASLSEDKELIKLYQSGDIYSELAKAIFGDENKRSTAKQVFISFLYGMPEERIANILNIGNSDKTEFVKTATETLKLFFSKFSQALDYRDAVKSELLENGRVDTPLGGHRKRSNRGRLSNKEKRWALSQRIQGTGSLIFKEAVLKVAKELGRSSIILPMHDAFLLQLSLDEYDLKKDIAISLMYEAMKDRCSKIEPKISIENFAQS